MTTGHALWASVLDKHKEPGYVANTSGILPPDRAPVQPMTVPICGEGLLYTLDTKGHLPNADHHKVAKQEGGKAQKCYLDICPFR